MSTNMSVMGQSYGGSHSESLTGFQLGMGFIPLITAIAAAYFIFNNPRYVLWCGIICLLFSANTFFGVVPTGNLNSSISYGDMGGFSAKSGFEFGLYLFAFAAAALTFFAYRENNLQPEPINEAQEQPQTTTTEEPEQPQP